jgi:hypothetical protein
MLENDKASNHVNYNDHIAYLPIIALFPPSSRRSRPKKENKYYIYKLMGYIITSI